MTQSFAGSVHVGKVGLSTASDSEIINYAIKNEYVIVSKDYDFFEYISYNGSPPKLILLKTGNTSTKRIIELLQSNIENIQRFITDNSKDILELS